VHAVKVDEILAGPKLRAVGDDGFRSILVVDERA
jgi:hypothetical protein